MSEGRTFTEPDLAKCVERFRELTGEKPTPAKIQAAGFEYDATDPEQLAIFGSDGILSRGAWEAAAEGDDRAMLLLMMNGAYYIGEVIDLRWDDIQNGCMIARRKETGKHIRVCSLWSDTVQALEKVKRNGEYIFHTYAGLPIRVSGAQRRWQRLALAAGLATARRVNYGGRKKDVIKCHATASQLRDGAATAAAEANVTERLIALMLGHRTGISDFYVKRNPKMAKPATDAVYAHYMRR